MGKQHFAGRGQAKLHNIWYIDGVARAGRGTRAIPIENGQFAWTSDFFDANREFCVSTQGLPIRPNQNQKHPAMTQVSSPGSRLPCKPQTKIPIYL
jgi:hypothetical protein